MCVCVCVCACVRCLATSSNCAVDGLLVCHPQTDDMRDVCQLVSQALAMNNNTRDRPVHVFEADIRCANSYLFLLFSAVAVVTMVMEAAITSRSWNHTE